MDSQYSTKNDSGRRRSSSCFSSVCSSTRTGSHNDFCATPGGAPMARSLLTSWRRWFSQLGPASRQGKTHQHSPWRKRLLLEALEERIVLSPINYVVTSTADSGAGTLRDAITQINAGNPSYTKEIDFAIGTVGSAQTISPASSLPAITTSGVYINGLSQGGSGNTTRL